jgi:hypothetical protein
MIAKSKSLRPRQTWRPASLFEAVGAAVVVAVAAIIVLAMATIVVVAVGLVILIARNMFWAARRYYRRSTSS